MATPLSIEQLMGREAGDLGISPALAAWWSGDHSAAAPHWFAQEADLRAAYTKYALLLYPLPSTLPDCRRIVILACSEVWLLAWPTLSLISFPW